MMQLTLLNMEIGEVFRRIRNSKSLTQEWLSDAAGISVATLQNYEASKTSPILPAYYKICKLLEIDPCLPIREIFGETTITENANTNSYLSERISQLEKKQEDLIAENAVLKYKLLKYEEPGNTASKKAV